MPQVEQVEHVGRGTVSRLDVAEFRQVGYLAELNRRFLHPLGLALEVVVEDDGSARLGGVWDYRDDPEGIAYVNPPNAEQAARIDKLWAERELARRAALGYMVQPA